MTRPDPGDYAWWLASRAAGLVALLCIAASVGIGLAMASRMSSGARTRRVLVVLHQQTALVGLVAIAVHGITLLGDHYLRPGLTGISVPFVIDHARAWTAMGVIGGWLAAILGLSYWIRGWIGARRWRKLHRATILVYVLAVAHTLGAGTDASEPWMRVILVVTGAPILFLFVMRVLPAPSRAAANDRFRAFRVAAKTPESDRIASFTLEPADGSKVAAAAPGQFVPVRVELPGAGKLVRNYSLSGAAAEGAYRISVKREEHGAVSRHLHDRVGAGSVLELGPPAGAFTLDPGAERPVALVSAGVGVTPLLAMLHALAHVRSSRPVWWAHVARNGREHAFREEVRALVARLPNARTHISYTRPGADDVRGRDFDARGRLTADGLLALGVPLDADFHLCGPSAFLADMRAGLRAAGVDPERLHSESFGPDRPAAGAHAPLACDVDFARSGRSVPWDERFESLLDLAEAAAVPTNASCRVGSCHECATSLLAGDVCYPSAPLAAPPTGQVLLCCARPAGAVVLDL